MTGATKVDISTRVIGIRRDLRAEAHSELPDPGVPVDGMTFGVAHMAENAPHGGERHPDGDELLYLVSGRARIVFTDSDDPDTELRAGDAVIVKKGLWHRVDILEPCHIVYLTPGPNNEVRPV